MRLKCNKCNSIIEGDGKGTYITCECGAIAIDETKHYYKVNGNFEDFKIIDGEEELAFEEYNIKYNGKVNENEKPL